MNKKLLALFLIACMSISLFAGLTACNSTPSTIQSHETNNENSVDSVDLLNSATYTRVDETHLTFGSYPQTEITDTTLIASLNTAAGTLPTSASPRKWTSYRYYVLGYEAHYMWYIDITHQGETYRGVYFTGYRPQVETWSHAAGSTRQDENGYAAETVYWFRFEPITWRILSEENGEALLLCTSILDCQQYDFAGGISQPTTNNYAISTIRLWLNYQFYNTAFNTAEQSLILQTTIRNDSASTNPYSTPNQNTNPYACTDTTDYVFLLSMQDITNTAYGFTADQTTDTARQLKNTAYAKVQGAFTNTGSYAGNGYWWLRSPLYSDASMAQNVNPTGATGSIATHYNHQGIVPAIRICTNTNS